MSRVCKKQKKKPAPKKGRSSFKKVKVDPAAARLKQVTLTQLENWRDAAVKPGSVPVADHAMAPARAPARPSTPEPERAESEYQLTKFNEKATYVTKKGEIIDLCGTSSDDDHCDSGESETESGESDSTGGSVASESQNLLDEIPSQQLVYEGDETSQHQVIVGGSQDQKTDEFIYLLDNSDSD